MFHSFLKLKPMPPLAWKSAVVTKKLTESNDLNFQALRFGVPDLWVCSLKKNKLPNWENRFLGGTQRQYVLTYFRNRVGDVKLARNLNFKFIWAFTFSPNFFFKSGTGKFSKFGHVLLNCLFRQVPFWNLVLLVNRISGIWIRGQKGCTKFPDFFL